MKPNRLYMSSLIKKVQIGDLAEEALKNAGGGKALKGGIRFIYREKEQEMTRAEAEKAVTDAADAFAELFLLTEDGQMSLAKHYLHDESLAREAVTDVYTRVRRGIGRLKDPSVFEPWVRGFTFMKCYSLRRLSSASETADPSGPPDETEITEAFRTMDLRRMLGSLPIPERESLLLRYSAGLKPSRIAAEMGVSETKAASFLEKGRREMLHFLKDAEGETKS